MRPPRAGAWVAAGGLGPDTGRRFVSYDFKHGEIVDARFPQPRSRLRRPPAGGCCRRLRPTARAAVPLPSRAHSGAIAGQVSLSACARARAFCGCCAIATSSLTWGLSVRVRSRGVNVFKSEQTGFVLAGAMIILALASAAAGGSPRPLGRRFGYLCLRTGFLAGLLRLVSALRCAVRARTPFCWCRAFSSLRASTSA